MKNYLANQVGERAGELIGAYRKAYPDMPPNIWPLVDTMFRAGVLRTAKLKAPQGDAVFSYLFAWRSPVLDYAWAAGHSSELAFVFDNAALGAQSSGGGREVERLTEALSQAWINFARTGDPSHPGLPHWSRYTGDHPATLIFDVHSREAVGHDADLIRLQSK